ncbi:MAG: hypothetical protein JST68_19260 [Bacteroidetes bacterium]|nr:hypothetical protein [Bacteroidota bacterium]
MPISTCGLPYKGVYTNIDEFRNNAPSITGYEVTKDKQANLELRIRDIDGNLYYSHTMWGFCDGQQIYVMMDGNLFPIFSVQHQMYVLGSKEYRTSKIPLLFLVPLSPGIAYLYGVATYDAAVLLKLDLFRLNMETGEVID